MSVDIHRVQSRLLEMGKAIADILEYNGIPYMITFGTLLGAVRHGGFIPWDDDFDMFLFDDTYESALSVLRKELPKDMFLEYFDSEPKYFHSWAHVKDTNTIASCDLYPQDNSYVHKGISIDLYRAKKMKESEIDEYLVNEHIAYLQRLFKNNLISKEHLFSKEAELKQQLKDTNSSDSIKEIFAMTLAERSMLIEDVLPLKKYKFANVEFFGPYNASKVLTGFYGSYMELPPVEARQPHYDSVLFRPQ